MAILPTKKDLTAELIFNFYKNKVESKRAYLGASAIGQECERALWYSFRWVTQEEFDGRMLRLFESGHREESRIVENLKNCGLTVHEVDDNGNQFSFVDLDGHFKGNCDGAALGVPDAPKTWHLLEVKTSSTKSFLDIKKRGVIISKSQHYAQMQIYMHYLGLTRALYICVCKENDDIYTERVEYNKKAALSLIEKAKRIIEATEPPDRLPKSEPEYPPCSWCASVNLCWKRKESLPPANCRTCLYSEASKDGLWNCTKHKKNLDVKSQELGCDNHLYIPSIVPMELIEVHQHSDGVVIEYKSITGESWYNHENSIDDNKFTEVPF
jgi:hypothetical protein